MMLVIAQKAKLACTFTNHFIFGGEVGFVNDIFTIGFWTPPDIFIEFCELFAVPFVISLIIIDSIVRIFNVFQILKEFRMRNHNITPELRALGKHTNSTLASNFFFQMLGPANCAELVAAD